MKRSSIVVFTLIVCGLLDLTYGLRCYTCSYDEKDKESNELCITAPWNLTGNPIRTCLPNFKYCIIVRIESKQTEKVTSFLRKCEENPMEDSDVDSSTVVAHYRSCMTDLCNNGDGLHFVDEGHEGDSVAILVPDKRSSAVIPRTSHLLLSLTFLYFSQTFHSLVNDAVK